MTKHVEIRQVGRAIAVQEGVTILEAALADGIAYPHGCRSGRCASCKSRLVSGAVDLLDHSRFALSEEEKAQGLILACRAIPRTDATVAWIGGDEETASHPRRRLNCRVEAIKDATHDIKRIWLTIVGGDPLSFTAGQYARLTFPDAPTRDYSMASEPGERELEFHIRQGPARVRRLESLCRWAATHGRSGHADRYGTRAAARRPACRCVFYARRSIGCVGKPVHSVCQRGVPLPQSCPSSAPASGRLEPVVALA